MRIRKRVIDVVLRCRTSATLDALFKTVILVFETFRGLFFAYSDAVLGALG
jgi:hypothetical protein